MADGLLLIGWVGFVCFVCMMDGCRCVLLCLCLRRFFLPFPALHLLDVREDRRPKARRVGRSGPGEVVRTVFFNTRLPPLIDRGGVGFVVIEIPPAVD